MERSLMAILLIDKNRIKELIDKARTMIENLLVETPLEKLILEAEIVSSKLENGLNKLKSDFNNYFRLVTEPAIDEISDISNFQLDAEEVLCELKVKFKRAKPSENVEEKRMVTGRLPKLNLPEYDGNILEWYQFWDQFSSNIDSRSISDVDKLLYLKSSLKGEASKIIEGLETTNSNYGIAITTLKERYGRKEQVVDAHYAALNKIEPADKTLASCRTVLSDIDRHLRVLKSLGENTDHSYLRFLIMEKFPEDLVYEVRKKIKGGSIEEIRTELRNIISAREDAYRVTQSKEAQTDDEDKKKVYTTETLHTMERRNHNESLISQRFRKRTCSPQRSPTYSSPGRRPFKRTYQESTYVAQPERKRAKLTCIFCKEDHYNDRCYRFTTSKDRKSQLGNKCFNCLKPGHIANECREKTTCIHCKVLGHHNRALCPKRFFKAEATKQFYVNEAGLTVLQTAIVGVRDDEYSSKQLKRRVLLDSGSQRTYITQKTAKELDLKVKEETRLTIFTFGAKAPQEVESPVVTLQIVSRFGKVIPITANVVPMITQSVPYIEVNVNHKVEKSKLADDGSLSDSIDLLIGNDYYFSLISTEKTKIKENLYLINSDLGWIVSGKTDSKQGEEMTVITYFQTNLEIKLNQPDLPLNEGNLQELWNLESIGIHDSPKEDREDEAIRKFNETTEYISNRYYVSWPWIEYPPPLTSNLGLAFGRLVNLVKRLDDTTLTSYDETIKEQIKKGIVETVPNTKGGPSSHPIHYLPFHGVAQRNKPIRLVYDASSKTKDNKSLNQCLYCGPMMLEDLTGLLLKFRCHTIGICSDVEKAFLQIGLKEVDRDVTRFLWLKDVNGPVVDNNLLHLRFCRVPFGIISSPFLLNATIKYHLQKSNNVRMQQLANDIYVDNLVTGVKTEKEAIDLYKDSKEAFQGLSMNLREWSSNCNELMSQITDPCKESMVKVLGLNWCTNEDTLQLRFNKDTHVKPNTKRELLKIIASVYDPCGFAVPLLLSAKLFLQELWKSKIKWDSPLPQTMNRAWEEIQKDLNNIDKIVLPRCYFRNFRDKECQIHCFTDSSTRAYAAAVYVINGNEKSFVMGKSRLVPIKEQENLSIPRLELLGVLIGCRLIKYVLSHLHLNVTRQLLWTDSQIVIDWCKSDKLLPPFVARRVEEIKKNKDLEIRYVPSEINPADVATRTSISREDKEKWLAGPQFLIENSSTWPSNTNCTASFLAGEGLSKEDNEVEHDAEVIQNVKNKGSQSKQGTDLGSGDEQHESEIIAYTTFEEIKEIQAEHFPEELKGKETSLKRNLGLFHDENGILRCRGRLKNTGWPYGKRYPILIPRDSEFTNKIIMKAHTDNYHVGAAHTLTTIRQSFWIPQGRRQTQKVLRKCPRCIKHAGGPFKLPPVPELPPERVNYSAPFTFTGVDYLGPVLVKTEAGAKKRWICLFTCLAVRAVHLELVQDLTAEEGLMALRRMISARGIPTMITSDNATNFKLMSEILEQPFCIERKLRWRFIPQLAPWFGGFYERLIGIVKNCLKKTLGKHLLTDSQLNTIVKEIEAVVNSRPLTYVDTELSHILKPADFLAMGRTITVGTVSDGSLPQGTQTKTDLIKSWKKGITVLEEFKEMFTNRYLLSLRERYSHSHKQPRSISDKEPTVGQIVQIKGDGKNREDWKVGKIISLPKGADGLCRVAVVQVGKREYTRSLAHLYPLEIEDEEHAIHVEKPPHQTDKELTENGTLEVTQNLLEDTEQEEEVQITDIRREEEMFDNNLNPIDIEEGIINEEKQSEGCSEQRQRRGAATKALEKIKLWTQNLLTLL